jgi:hypothetical protein
MAMNLRAINTIPAEQQAVIRKQLIAYCLLDTFAMVRLWQFLTGCGDLKFCAVMPPQSL